MRAVLWGLLCLAVPDGRDKRDDVVWRIGSVSHRSIFKSHHAGSANAVLPIHFGARTALYQKVWKEGAHILRVNRTAILTISH